MIGNRSELLIKTRFITQFNIFYCYWKKDSECEYVSFYEGKKKKVPLTEFIE
jgi:hypothetical protein